jgi:hypothetical protein
MREKAAALQNNIPPTPDTQNFPQFHIQNPNTAMTQIKINNSNLAL